MSRSSYMLITTSDEGTWEPERPLLFAGEWCKLYSRKTYWSQFEYQTLPPIGRTQIEKNVIFNKLQPIVDELLLDLVKELNRLHGLEYSKRAWQIILGHWVTRYTQAVYHRYSVVEYAFKNYRIDQSIFYKTDDFQLVSDSSTEFIASLNENVWNNVLFCKIIEYLKLDIRITFIPYSKPISQNSIVKNSMKKKFKNFYTFSAKFFVRNTDAFILRSYLPSFEELKLQFSLGQIPMQWAVPGVVSSPVDKELRKSLQFNKNSYTGFEKFLRLYVKETLPTVYLEGFKKCHHVISNLAWPSNPQFIFTSNAFDTDEIFKIWVASKVESGVPYFTGQHGNNYGTHFAARGNFSPELITSDAFFSWGWRGDNIVPAFNFKMANKPAGLYDKKGGLLLVEITCQELHRPWDEYAKHEQYQIDQFNFIKNLRKPIQKEVIVRLMGLYVKNNWFEDLRWKDVMPEVQLEKGVAKMNDLIKKSRLIVHSYDSTGILETLSLNIPTMCFWQNGLNHLVPEAQVYYQLLVDANIIALSPESLAENINKHWDNLDAWWFSEAVQSARIKFCEQYSRSENYPITTLKKLLRKKTSEIKRDR